MLQSGVEQMGTAKGMSDVSWSRSCQQYLCKGTHRPAEKAEISIIEAPHTHC